jgi:hypothetical protein
MWPIISAILAALAFGTLGGVIAYMIKLNTDASNGDGKASALQSAMSDYWSNSSSAKEWTIGTAAVLALLAGVGVFMAARKNLGAPVVPNFATM